MIIDTSTETCLIQYVLHKTLRVRTLISYMKLLCDNTYMIIHQSVSYHHHYLPHILTYHRHHFIEGRGGKGRVSEGFDRSVDGWIEIVGCIYIIIIN